MNWFNRIVILTLILCLSRTPIPWGHSHRGMDARQLAAHLCLYHSATSEGDLPEGWHWHVSQIGVGPDGETVPSPVAAIERHSCKSLLEPTLDRAIVVYPVTLPRKEGSIQTGISSAHACYQQRTYLRFNVLLI